MVLNKMNKKHGYPSLTYKAEIYDFTFRINSQKL